MNNKNWWGEPDDVEPLPEWMDPRTYQNNNQYKRKVKSLNETIEETLKKPAVPVIVDSMFSEKGYETCSLEDAEEFAKKRNYDY